MNYYLNMQIIARIFNQDKVAGSIPISEEEENPNGQNQPGSDLSGSCRIVALISKKCL